MHETKATTDKQRRKGHARDRQRNAGEGGLHQRRDDDAERDAADRLRRQPDDPVALLAAVVGRSADSRRPRPRPSHT